MAWSNSKVFAVMVLDAVNDVNAVNLASDTFKCALYNNAITPDNTVTLANSEYNAGQWVNTNEQSQVGQWAAGGVALSSQSSTQTSNVVTFTAGNTVSGSNTTLANVFGCLIYDTTVTSAGICFLYFGGSNSVTGGTFTVAYNASGIATFTC